MPPRLAPSCTVSARQSGLAREIRHERVSALALNEGVAMIRVISGFAALYRERRAHGALRYNGADTEIEGLASATVFGLIAL